MSLKTCNRGDHAVASSTNHNPPASKPNPERCYGSLQAAQRLGIRVTVLRDLLGQPDSPRHMQNGGRTMYRETDLVEWESSLPNVTDKVFALISSEFGMVNGKVYHEPTGRTLSWECFLAAFERHGVRELAGAWLHRIHTLRRDGAS